MGTIGCGAITSSGKLTINQGSNINSIRAEHSGTNSSGIVLIGNSLTEAAGHYISTSNAGFVATSGLIHGYVSNVLASGKVAVFKQVGTGDTLFLDTNGNAKSLNIDSESTTVDAINAQCDAITTGAIARLASASATTNVRNLVEVINDNAAAVGTTPLMVQQDAVTSTNFKKIATFAGFSIWVSDGTTAEGALTGVVGDICLNGGTGNGQTAYCDTAGTNWTDM